MTEFSFKTLDETETAIWWEVAEQCPHATFFHTPIWHEIAVSAYDKFESVTVMAQLADGTRVIVPMVKERRAMIFQRLLSTFGYCYGGYISDRPISVDQVSAIYSRVCNWKATSYYFLESPLADPIDLSETMTSHENVTQIVELDSGDFDTVFARFSKKHRRSYRKGIEAGLVVEEAQTLDQYKTYYEIYQDSIRRWEEKHDRKPTSYPWSLFEAVYNASKAYPDNVKVFLAKLDGKIISGQMNFYFKEHIVSWHGSTLEEYFSVFPVNVLDTELMRDGIAKGYKYYDFNPSDGFDGVSAFKRRFGAKEYPMKFWLYENRVWRTVKSAASRLRG